MLDYKSEAYVDDFFIKQDEYESYLKDMEEYYAGLDSAYERAQDYEKRINEAVSILKKIDWVGSGAKGLISDAIGVLTDGI